MDVWKLDIMWVWQLLREVAARDHEFKKDAPLVVSLVCKHGLGFYTNLGLM